MVRHLFLCQKPQFNQICINPYPAFELVFLRGRKMPLPNILEFIGTNITQRKFQQAQAKLINFVDELDKRQSATANGYYKSYATLSAANADIANIPLGVSVKILSAENGGDYYKSTENATVLTKSAYDPLTQAIKFAKELPVNSLNNKSTSKSDLYSRVFYDKLYFAGSSINKLISDFGGVHYIKVTSGVKYYLAIPKDTPINRLEIGAVNAILKPDSSENSLAIVNKVDFFNTTIPTIKVDSKDCYLLEYTSSADYLALYTYFFSATANMHLDQQDVYISTNLNADSFVKTKKYAVDIIDDIRLSQSSKENIFDALPANYVCSHLDSTPQLGYVLHLDSGEVQTNSQSNASLYVLPVQPSKNYTLVSLGSKGIDVGEFFNEPKEILRVKVDLLINNSTFVKKVYNSTETLIVGNFTTSAETKFLLVSQKINVRNPRFVLFEGVIDINHALPILTNNQVKMGRELHIPKAVIPNLTTSNIVKGKNLFNKDRDLVFNAYFDGGVGALSQIVFRSNDRENKKGSRIAIVAVKPSTTYTVSKKGGNRFKIGWSRKRPSYISVSQDYGINVIFEDHSASSYTFTTDAEANYIEILCAFDEADYSDDFLQVELGNTQTPYETYGYKFSPEAKIIEPAINSEGGLFSAGVGDGVADDADNLIASIALMRGVINFDPTKRYKVTKTIEFNLANLTRINGNGVTLIPQGDIAAIRIKGSMINGHAGDTISTQNYWRKEAGFVLDQVKVHTLDDDRASQKSGYGIQLIGTCNVTLRNVHTAHLKKGILISGQNRNINIVDSYIWANTESGIEFDNTCKLHQINITGCHILFNRINIFLNDAEMYNIQIVGNDIEVDGTLTVRDEPTSKYCILAIANERLIEDLTIVGNTIEDHWHCIDGMIKLQGKTTGHIVSVSIGANSTGNSPEHVIALGGCSGVEIRGQYKGSIKSVLKFIGDVDGVRMDVQQRPANGMVNGGLVFSDGYYNIKNVNTSGSSMCKTNAYAVNIIGAKSIVNSRFSDMVIETNGSSTQPAIKIHTETVKGLRVDSNQISNDSQTTSVNVIDIAASNVSGKNSMMNNSADKGTFVAPSTFKIEGNW